MQKSPLEQITEKLLSTAEEKFGPRLKDWEFIGIEINNSPPFLKYYHENGQIAISLSQRVVDNDFELISQLAHEICHLLHPSIEFPSLIKNPTLIINEGLSTFYSIAAMDELLNAKEITINSYKKNSLNYYSAYLLVKELIDFDDDSIKKIREVCPRIDKVTKDHFISAKINCSKNLIQRLLTKFT